MKIFEFLFVFIRLGKRRPEENLPKSPSWSTAW